MEKETHMHKIARPQLSQAGRKLSEQCTCSGFGDALLPADELCHIPSRAILHDQEYSPLLLCTRKHADQWTFVALQCATCTRLHTKVGLSQEWRDVRGISYVLPASRSSKSLCTTSKGIEACKKS